MTAAPGAALQIALGNGRSFNVLQRGSGRPIVLIHGAITTHADWLGDPLQGFIERGRALAVDRPGHGDSRRARFEAAPLQQARHIRQGLAALGIERPLIVGHSLGGMTAMAYAAAFPDEVGALLLIAPIAFPEMRPIEQSLFGPRGLPFTGPWITETARLGDPLLLQMLHRVMFAPQRPPPEWRRRYPWDKVLSREQMTAEGEDSLAILPTNPDAYFRLESITAPTTIVSGTRDLIAIPERHAKPLARRLPHARLILLDGIGHMVHHCATGEVLAAADALMARD